MSTPTLREELDALADTQTFSPDPGAWDRGRRVRRRDRLVGAASVLALVVLLVGVGTAGLRPSAVAPADRVPDGAIPSVVPPADDTVLTDLAIGRASVAYVAADGTPVLVDATTGAAHAAELPDFPPQEAFSAAENRRGPWLALSPDGRRLAYPASTVRELEPGTSFVVTPWYRTVDLETGDSELVQPPQGRTPLGLAWTAQGELVVDAYAPSTVRGQEPDTTSWLLDPLTGTATERSVTGVPAPTGGLSAVLPVDDSDAPRVRFEASSGAGLDRALPTDLYPDGAHVVPLGWADDGLLVAEVDAPAGSRVVGHHLAVLTSPDRPEAEWTWRTLVGDLPRTVSISIAVDLVPDLDDPEQRLTHDFSAAPDDDRGVLPYVLGGLALAAAGLGAVGLVRRRP